MLNNRRLLFCKETPQDGWFISQESMQDHQGFRGKKKEEEEDRDWEDENIWNLESHNEVLGNWHLGSTSISHKKQTWRKKKSHENFYGCKIWQRNDFYLRKFTELRNSSDLQSKLSQGKWRA